MIWEMCIKGVLSEPACVERSLWEDVPSFVEVQWDLVYHVEVTQMHLLFLIYTY